MAEELKELIEKIQQEGINAAEDKASKIEARAKDEAQAIIERAKQEAARLIAEARDQNIKMQKNTEACLQQAGRDLLLGLRKEINAMLDRLISQRLRQALTPKELLHIISALVEDYSHKGKENIIISLKKEDLDNLEKGFLSDLTELIKKGIVLKPSEDILGGFSISYDAGKSHFDFTDQAMAEYISAYLKPTLAQILKPK